MPELGEISIYQWSGERDKLISYLKSLGNDEIAIVSQKSLVRNSPESIEKTFEEMDSDIVFGASAEFNFDNPDLRSYYWKYYPRKSSPYDFINPDFFIGKSKFILEMFSDLEQSYPDNSINDAFHRLFVDTEMNFLATNYRIKFDHKQLIFGNTSGRAAISRWPLFSSIHSYLFFKNEKMMLDSFVGRNAYYDFKQQNSVWFNLKTGQTPVLFEEESGEKSDSGNWVTSFKAYLKSSYRTIITLLHNKGEYRLYRLFRFSPNLGKDVSQGIDKLMRLLKDQVPFCFSHFNDGELTFISKHQKGDHREVWFGRRQNQYTEKLGQLLVEAFLLRKENYFVGIPCGKSHPRLRRKATELRSVDEFTIAAMTLHHNIDRYPEILGLLKDRELYFVVNPYQDLTFFKALGLKVKEENMIVVPFKNSHKEYDKLKDHQFESGSVVLMMCGMLGKVLTPIWFDNNPNTTFLTFGSSFDDFIQKNINFRLYPSEAPFARHIYGTRSFLFGAKKRCSDCFDLKKPEVRE